ncbi:HAMP domain-containing sensor histidine kinase [Micromonospora sp. KC721]|uniref:HAMP domain-containing sensor histidine kinase n=1 Tax=Micromonospora sp. KC721 TaxID=2530380 RepID=UPI00104F047F|nr:HAMP domain-containing sensor histidine kinase [Micromonospora sp. KC721]TDB70311.1 HAMP domain-containing histidine kinase [Micromonospora sp. KC721]
MNVRSPGRRILVLCGVLLVAGQFAPLVAEHLLGWWREFGPEWCVVPPGRAPDGDASFVCVQVFRRPSIPLVATLVVVLALLLAAAYPAMGWCLRPVRDLARGMENVGPQNLGHRLHPGSGRDELAELGRAIDEMMDRIAVGYEAQRRFAADASHELRTPLAVQRTLIEVGMAGSLTADQLSLLTTQLLKTNERNERLIEGLLVLSESDRGLVVRAPQRLDRIVATVLDAHRPRAAEAGVAITSTLRPRVVLGEQVLLERLITNLVQNALKYNRTDGTIDVRVGEDPALVVSNTGDDVPPEEVPALFEPFRRRSGTRIDHSGGAGLGLAIARSITRAHEGTIVASSTGHDGLRVQVSFPAVSSKGATA